MTKRKSLMVSVALVIILTSTASVTTPIPNASLQMTVSSPRTLWVDAYNDTQIPKLSSAPKQQQEQSCLEIFSETGRTKKKDWGTSLPFSTDTIWFETFRETYTAVYRYGTTKNPLHVEAYDTSGKLLDTKVLKDANYGLLMEFKPQRVCALFYEIDWFWGTQTTAPNIMSWDPDGNPPPLYPEPPDPSHYWRAQSSSIPVVNWNSTGMMEQHTTNCEQILREARWMNEDIWMKNLPPTKARLTATVGNDGFVTFENNSKSSIHVDIYDTRAVWSKDVTIGPNFEFGLKVAPPQTLCLVAYEVQWQRNGNAPLTAIQSSHPVIIQADYPPPPKPAPCPRCWRAQNNMVPVNSRA